VSCRDAQGACASREDCHPWARPPFTPLPFLLLCKFVWELRFFGSLPPTDFCRLDSRYGHTHRAPISSPASDRRAPHGGRRSPALANRLDRGQVPDPVFAMSQFDSIEGANLQHPFFPCGKSGPSRSGSTEASEGLARGECPSSCSVGHPLSPTRCRERIGVSSAAPCATSPFESRGAWLIELTKLFVPAPPAKENAFPKTKMPFTVSSSFSVREDRSPCPFRTRSPCHAAAGLRLFREACQICSSSEWHCNKEYQRLLPAPRAPKP